MKTIKIKDKIFSIIDEVDTNSGKIYIYNTESGQNCILENNPDIEEITETFGVDDVIFTNKHYYITSVEPTCYNAINLYGQFAKIPRTTKIERSYLDKIGFLQSLYNNTNYVLTKNNCLTKLNSCQTYVIFDNHTVREESYIIDVDKIISKSSLKLIPAHRFREYDIVDTYNNIIKNYLSGFN